MVQQGYQNIAAKNKAKQSLGGKRIQAPVPRQAQVSNTSRPTDLSSTATFGGMNNPHAGFLTPGQSFAGVQTGPAGAAPRSPGPDITAIMQRDFGNYSPAPGIVSRGGVTSVVGQPGQGMASMDDQIAEREARQAAAVQRVAQNNIQQLQDPQTRQTLQDWGYGAEDGPLMGSDGQGNAVGNFIGPRTYQPGGGYKSQSMRAGVMDFLREKDRNEPTQRTQQFNDMTQGTEALRQAELAKEGLAPEGNAGNDITLVSTRAGQAPDQGNVFGGRAALFEKYQAERAAKKQAARDMRQEQLKQRNQPMDPLTALAMGGGGGGGMGLSPLRHPDGVQTLMPMGGRGADPRVQAAAINALTARDQEGARSKMDQAKFDLEKRKVEAAIDESKAKASVMRDPQRFRGVSIQNMIADGMDPAAAASAYDQYISGQQETAQPVSDLRSAQTAAVTAANELAQSTGEDPKAIAASTPNQLLSMVTERAGTPAAMGPQELQQIQSVIKGKLRGDPTFKPPGKFDPKREKLFALLSGDQPVTPAGIDRLLKQQEANRKERMNAISDTAFMWGPY